MQPQPQPQPQPHPLHRTQPQPLPLQTPPPSFHRRTLPTPPCVAFSSDEGRRLFLEALEAGYMRNYFTLAEQFITQDEPSFCGLSSLVMVLNSLLIDPGRIWKGPWRWFHETMLDCCEPLDVIKERGLSLSGVACLARCNGASVTVVHADNTTVEAFRDSVKDVCSSTGELSALICAYSRRTFGQSGDGHFSPIGGYHPRSDQVLILDVARFKYPPHWVPLPLLFQAMNTLDPASTLTRGFLIVRREFQDEKLFFRIRPTSFDKWHLLGHWLKDMVDCICSLNPISATNPNPRECCTQDTACMDSAADVATVIRTILSHTPVSLHEFMYLRNWQQSSEKVVNSDAFFGTVGVCEPRVSMEVGSGIDRLQQVLSQIESLRMFRIVSGESESEIEASQAPFATVDVDTSSLTVTQAHAQTVLMLSMVHLTSQSHKIAPLLSDAGTGEVGNKHCHCVTLAHWLKCNTGGEFVSAPLKDEVEGVARLVMELALTHNGKRITHPSSDGCSH